MAVGVGLVAEKEFLPLPPLPMTTRRRPGAILQPLPDHFAAVILSMFGLTSCVKSRHPCIPNPRLPLNTVPWSQGQISDSRSGLAGRGGCEMRFG